jgi:hypothetical protein
MSNPYVQPPQMVGPGSPVLDTNCPRCGERFKVQDLYLLVSRVHGDPPQSEAVATHLHCMGPPQT